MKFLIIFSLVLVASGSAAERASDSSAARERIAELRREIARHDALYHREAKPEINDADYDRLKRQLAELERAFPDAAKAAPPLSGVGDNRTGLFQTHRHRERMLSLDKVYTESEVRTFHARVTKAAGRADLIFVIEPKFDGLAISVTYEQGKLVRAVTRGNGQEGDDVTANVLQIPALPRALKPAAGYVWPELIELRGEVYVPFAEFDRVNEEREATGQPRFSSPRNLAAGTLRQVDAREIAARGLQVVFYGIGTCEPGTSAPTTQAELHAAIKAWGLPGINAVHWWTAVTADEIVDTLNAVNRARGEFEFPTDGAVVKLDSFARQREVGASESAPRWAMAFKFAPERIETQVRGITLQVGRTGVLTPVAELAPVMLGGATIARATLHNREEIRRKDIRVGDFVFIERAGEIIPAVIAVNLARRPASAQPFVFPIECPGCGASLARSEVDVAVRCVNPSCPDQLRRRIEHFASKACVDIDGLGPAMIESIVARGWVKDLPDLYRLPRTDLLTLGRNNAKSVDRLLTAIEKSKRAELWRIIHGLGIPQVGAVTAKDLARQCGSLAGLVERGAAAASGVAEPRVRALITELIAVGVGGEVDVRDDPDPVEVSSRIAGKVFVLTGTLPSLTRAQATARIEAAGGKVAGSVTRATDFLVVGTEPGAKLDQARRLGVAIIGEAELLRMIEE